jgi:hypothetical protein
MDEMTKEDIIAALHEKGLSDDDIRQALGDRIKKEDPGFIARVMAGMKDDALVLGGSTLGAKVLGIPGAVLGGMAGEAATQLETGVERFAGVPEGQTTFQRPDATLNDPLASVTKTVNQGTSMGAGEGMGNAIIAGGAKLAAPFKDKIMPAVKEAVGTFSKKVGGVLLPSQQIEGGVLKGAESIARSGIGAGGIMERFLKKQAGDVTALGKAVAEEFAPAMAESPTAIGSLFLDTIKEGKVAHGEAAGKLFQQLDSMVSGTVNSEKAGGQVAGALVDLGPAKKIASEIAGKFKRIGDVGKSDAAGSIISKFEMMGPGLNFMDAHALRSQLTAESRELAKKGEGAAKSVVDKLARSVDDSMETAAKDVGGDVYEFWRRANSFVKEGKEAFNNSLIENLVNRNKQTPSSIGEELFRSGNYEEVIAAQRAIHNAAEFAKKSGKTIDEKGVWDTISQGYYKGLIEDASKSGQLDAGALLGKLNSSKTKRTLQAAFSPEQYAAIKDFAEIANKTQDNPGRSMVVKIVQSGIVVGAATAAINSDYERSGAGVGVVFGLGPVGIAWALTNPKTAKWLTTGLNLPAGSKMAGGLISRLMGEAIKYAPEGSIQVIHGLDTGSSAALAERGRQKVDLIDKLANQGR